ncbi:hypothetical protein [Natrinema hispanicum]|uniref:Uncharacterized protein n=1 Tax=Natrinema hispanicum TaxID=392421 RepID=A0A1I0IV55_9EURY|nr:hypothetical protein [Natrinema hispanicum]SEU01189.1 hypothetical protein SAMN04488694_12639 [Natrinema hispanicum]
MAESYKRRSLLASVGSVALLAGCMDKSVEDSVEYVSPEDADFSIDILDISLPNSQSIPPETNTTIEMEVTNKSDEAAESVSLDLDIYAKTDSFLVGEEDPLYSNWEQIGDLAGGESETIEYKIGINEISAVPIIESDCKFRYDAEISYHSGSEMHKGEHSISCPV